MKRILVVDDEPDVTLALRRFWKVRGLQWIPITIP